MITLYGFGPLFGLPDPSPFVLKSEVQLKMTGLDYHTAFGGLPIAPKGKLPFIDDDGERVADSTFIREHLERKYGVDFDEGLDPRRQAQAWAVERLLEDHLYWAMVHDRWLIDANFERGPANFFNGAPDAARETLRREARERVRQCVFGQGLGRHGAEEVTALAARSLGALSVLIGDQPFLMGDKPCGADATVFGFVAAVMSPLFDSPVRAEAERHANLIAYRDRMMRHWYPQFARETVEA